MKDFTNLRKQIYLSYLRAINSNFEMNRFNKAEIFIFVQNMEKNLDKLEHLIRNENEARDYRINYEILYKKKNKDFEKRPITTFSFFDEVLMQTIFTYIMYYLELELPKNNYGVECEDINSDRSFTHWANLYNKFINRFKKNMSSKSNFEYVYKFDLENFYPSISHELLIERIKKDIEKIDLNINMKNSLIVWVEKIINSYQEFDDRPFGLPQGPDFARFLSIYYIRLFEKYFFEELENTIPKITTNNQFDFFMYVDDGYVFTDADILASGNNECIQLSEKIIVESLKNALNKIQPLEKKLTLNVKKSKGMYLDEVDDKMLAEFIFPSIAIAQLDESFITQEEDFEYIKEISDLKTQYNRLRVVMGDIEQNAIEDYLKKKIKRRKSRISKVKTSRDILYSEIDETFSLKECTNDFDNLVGFEDMNIDYIFNNYLDKCSTYSDYIHLFSSYMRKIMMLKTNENDEYVKFEYYDAVLINAITSIDKNILNDSLKLNSDNIELILKGEHNTPLKYTVDLNASYYAYLLLISDHPSWRKHFYKGYREATCSIFNVHLTEYQQIIIENLQSYDSEVIGVTKNFTHNQSNFTFVYDNKLAVKQFYTISLRENLYGKFVQIINSKLFKNRSFDGNIYFGNLSSDFYFKEKNVGEFHLREELLELVNYWMIKQENGALNISHVNPNNIFLINKIIYILENDHEGYVIYNKNMKNVYYQEHFKELFYNVFNINYGEGHYHHLAFWQVRILASLNVERFNLSIFLEVAKDALENEEISQIIEKDLLQSLEIFEYVFSKSYSGQKYIDELLLTHQYYANIWKNGSKDLFFFTLHDQSHALKLIENYVKVLSYNIPLIRLNIYETFLLFVSCYLHDVAMLLEMKRHNLVDELLNNDIERFNQNSKIKNQIAHNLIKSHGYVESIIEKYVRESHPFRATEVINDITSLPINELERLVVGRVSENHGKHPHAVHGKNCKLSISRNRTIDIRKISIWLRFLDLSDVGKERVTAEVMQFYGGRMGEVSSLHWIKHLATNKLILNRKFKPFDENENNLEHTKVNLILELNYGPDAIKSSTQRSHSFRIDKLEDNEINNIDNNSDFSFDYYKIVREEHGEHSCNLLCNFIGLNNYLFEEIEIFNEYMSQNYKVNLECFVKVNKDYDYNRRKKFKKDYNNEVVTYDELIYKYFKN